MSKRALQILLVGYSLLLLYAGWMPMEFAYDPAALQAEWSNSLSAWPLEFRQFFRPGDVFTNVILFVPLGFMVAGAIDWGRWRWLTIPAAAGIAELVSSSIEIGQLFEPNRFTTVRDVLANVIGGALGGFIGLVVFLPPVWRAIRRLSCLFRNRHAELAAYSLMAVMVAATAWRIRPSLGLLARQWSDILWQPHEGLGVWPWHKWLLRWVAVFAALTLLLTGNRRKAVSDGQRMLTTAAQATAFACLLEGMRLLIPGPPPNAAAVALAALSACVAALVAPRLQRRNIELPMAVLACAVGMITLAIHLGWLSSGGGSRLPLWGLYKHEFSWGYYSLMRRWAAMGGVSFLLTFYLSLRKPWRMRGRMLLAWLTAASGATGLEVARLVFAGRIAVAIWCENLLAAAAGVLVFAILWRVLDRREEPAPDAPPFDGSDRRRKR